jgi:hypothetical protein
MSLFTENLFTEAVCDQFVLKINKIKNVIPIVHPCKWKSDNVYFNLFEIKPEVIEGGNKSLCKYRPINPIETKEDLKKLINLLCILNAPNTQNTQNTNTTFKVKKDLLDLYYEFERYLPAQ